MGIVVRTVSHMRSRAFDLMRRKRETAADTFVRHSEPVSASLVATSPVTSETVPFFDPFSQPSLLQKLLFFSLLLRLSSASFHELRLAAALPTPDICFADAVAGSRPEAVDFVEAYDLPSMFRLPFATRILTLPGTHF